MISPKTTENLRSTIILIIYRQLANYRPNASNCHKVNLIHDQMLQSIFIFVSFVSVKGFNFNANNIFRYSSNREIHNNLFSLNEKVLIPLAPLLPLHSSKKSDDSENFVEDLTYLNEEFSRIGNGKTKISYTEFLRSEAIQAILVEESDEYSDDIQEIWISQAKSLDELIDLNLFISINREVDDLFEYVDDEEAIEGEHLSIFMEDMYSY